VSFVHVLESMVAAAQSVGVRGAMYTAIGASWSTTSLVRFCPAAHSPTLRRLWAGSALCLPGVRLGLMKPPSLVVTLPRSPVYRLLAILG
jgi:hypothetical protein